MFSFCLKTTENLILQERRLSKRLTYANNLVTVENFLPLGLIMISMKKLTEITEVQPRLPPTNYADSKLIFVIAIRYVHRNEANYLNTCTEKISKYGKRFVIPV